MGQGCKDRGHQAAVRQLQRAGYSVTSVPRMAAIAELRSPAVVVLSERVSATGRARAHAGGECSGLLVVPPARRRSGGERARRQLDNGARAIRIVVSIVTPNKVAPAVRKVLARFPDAAAPTGNTRKTRRNRRRKL